MVLPLLLDLAAAPSAAPRLTILDAGCGSGNLILPLAARFPALNFVGLDCKPEAVTLLTRRALEAGLGNATARLCDIDAYPSHEPCDAVLALHACGGATDAALRLAGSRGVPFALAPCCIGKLGKKTSAWQQKLGVVNGAGGAQSTWLAAQLAAAVGGFGDFPALAACADQSESEPAQPRDAERSGGGGGLGGGGAERAAERLVALAAAARRRVRRAKTVVELDRLVASFERAQAQAAAHAAARMVAQTVAQALVGASSAAAVAVGSGAVAGAVHPPIGRILRMADASKSGVKSDMLLSLTPALSQYLRPACAV
jgi:SAM-dependent methyltransferase